MFINKIKNMEGVFFVLKNKMKESFMFLLKAIREMLDILSYRKMI